MPGRPEADEVIAQAEQVCLVRGFFEARKHLFEKGPSCHLVSPDDQSVPVRRRSREAKQVADQGLSRLGGHGLITQIRASVAAARGLRRGLRLGEE